MTDDKIKQTVINTTQHQRNYYIYRMQEEKKQSPDAPQNLSEWIIRHLPEVPETWKK